MKLLKIFIGIVCVGLVGCAGVGAGADNGRGVGGTLSGTPPEITVDYDPARSPSSAADNQAQERCGAYGKVAIFVDETRDTSGRLSHRHYACR